MSLGAVLCWVGCGAALVVGNTTVFQQAGGMEVVQAVALPLGVVLLGLLLV